MDQKFWYKWGRIETLRERWTREYGIDIPRLSIQRHTRNHRTHRRPAKGRDGFFHLLRHAYGDMWLLLQCSCEDEIGLERYSNVALSLVLTRKKSLDKNLGQINAMSLIWSPTGTW